MVSLFLLLVLVWGFNTILLLGKLIVVLRISRRKRPKKFVVNVMLMLCE